MICLITPTGGRPIQFSLCVQWMRKQTYPGKVTWIIVDDCIPQTIGCINENFRENWKIIKIYPLPSWMPGQNTQTRNIAAGIDILKTYMNEYIEAIFIIEDDDYYRPIYLERMMANFLSFSLIGEKNTIYYNVCHRRFVSNANATHASLFQTAFKIDLLFVFEQCLPNKFIDYVFWMKATNKYIFYENDLAVGIKGLPGRGGIGAGHSNAFAMRDDKNLIYLKALIGEDYKFYEPYFKNIPIANRSLFITR